MCMSARANSVAVAGISKLVLRLIFKILYGNIVYDMRVLSSFLSDYPTCYDFSCLR
jgi:hypothetical protein